MNIRLRFALPLIALLLGTVTASQAAQQYKVHNIGKQFNENRYSCASGINNKGEVVGGFVAQDNSYHGFFYSPITGFTDLGVGSASDINNLSQVVSSSYKWSPGTTPREWTPAREAYDINDSSVSVGQSSDAYLKPIAWTWGGQITYLNKLHNYGSAEAINNKGQIVGSSYDVGHCCHACTWSNSSSQEVLLYTQYPDTDSRAFDINDNGIIVGRALFQGASQGMAWNSNGALISILKPTEGTTSSVANGINNEGVIVGTSGIVACVWDLSGNPIELPNIPNSNNSSAFHVNDNGWISGFAYEGSTCYAVVWEPVTVPEPSSIMAILSGLACIGGIAVHKKNN